MEYAIHLFNAGGVVMYPLVLFMLAACTILFERIRMYRRIDSEIQQLSSSIEAGRNANDWIALEQAIKNNDDALSQFVTPIVDSVYNFEGLENRLHDVVGYMDERLKRGLNWLSMMVTMAPLLGLLGTVVGMIRSFAAVGGDIGAPTVITGGVSEALIATATGLSVAIVALAIHSWCTIIPMIDIVFFLLVFFMMSTLYMNTEEQIPLNLPKASASTAKTIEPITISLTATHKMYLNEREIRPDDLGNEIQAIVAKEPQQAFIVRASEDIAYKDVISILDNLKMSGARFVSVATERK